MPSQAISLMIAASAAGAGEAAKQTLPWQVVLLIVLALLTVPFILGGYLAKKIRMPDYGWKIGLVLCTLASGIVVIVFGWPPKLGIDLSGGVILIYEVDQSKKPSDEPLTSEQMEQLIRAVSKRVNPGGHKEVTIRECGVEQIEIIVPNVSEAEARQLEHIISAAGTLEFRILANKKDHRALINQALGEDAKTVKDSEGERRAWWVPVNQGREEELNYPEIATRTQEIGERTVTEILVVEDDFDVTGEYLIRASPGTDRRGDRCVNFMFNTVGGKLFAMLTSENLPDKVQEGFTRKLGIILDGELYSAPSIQDTIFERGEITGRFSKDDIESLVDVLNAGALPAALAKEPISRLFTGPTLGKDTIIKGSYAIAVSMILVLLFMLVYYRFSGIVACLALVANLVLILAIMIAVKAAFTLPGLAGLVLTVGMAVDANVLIFERIREELARGAALRMAIRNGFGRATTTIVDANLTTLITATVLWTIGTEQIKGFAVILWLGVVMSMYTAIFCSRVIFDIAERRRWLTKLTMMRIIGGTKIDFIGMRHMAAVASVAVIVIGMIGVVARGKGLLDIDFTGGSSVQILFNKDRLEKIDGEVQGVDIGGIREKLSDLPDLAVSSLRIEGEPKGIRFMINTSEAGFEKDRKRRAMMDVLREQLDEVFGAQAGTAKYEQAAKPIGEQLDTLLKAERDSDQHKAATKELDRQIDDVFAGATDPQRRDAALKAVRQRLKEIQQTSVEIVEEHLHVVFGDQLDSNSLEIEKLEEIKPAGAEAETPTPEKLAPKEPSPKEPLPKKPAPEEPATEEPASEGPPGKKPAPEETAPGKPTEEPTPEEATTEEPATEETATEEPASEEKPALEKPPDGEETTPAEPAKPDDGEQGRRGDLPDDSVWALAGATPLLMAQADPPDDRAADETPDKAAGEAEKPADETPSDKPAEKPADETPSDKPAEKPADETPSDKPAVEPADAAPGETPASQLPPPIPRNAATEAEPANPFAGGTHAWLKFKQPINHDTLEAMFVKHFGGEKDTPRLDIFNRYYEEQSSTAYEEWQVKIKLPPGEAKEVFDAIKITLEDTPYFPSSNTIGGKVARNTQAKAITALIASLLCIIGYIWVRFQRVVYGLAAVIALVHDVLITLGVLALSAYVAPYLGFLKVDPFKIGLPVLAAFLTIIGYSLNDTIVVFDRIREVKGKAPRLTREMVNLSINQTLSRTLLTSLTTLIVVVILYFGGGQGIHAFAFALVVGVLVGTYSSVFVASPALLWMSKSPEPE